MKATPQASDLPLCFGRFELRPREHRLLADGQAVPLGGRAMDLLLALAARPGELLTRNELIELVWPGRVVEDNNLSVQIKALRKALGDTWLVTVPGRGYRLDLPAPTSAQSAASAAPEAQRSPMPMPMQPLIGREADLITLQALLEQHRLVTVVGAGGIGKTRLSQATFQAQASLHPDGVCWVALEQVVTAEALPAAVATALGLATGTGDPLRYLTKALGDLKLLLALDNAEHLLGPVAAFTQTLLETCSGLQFLVTSQAPLMLAAEHVMRLGPLAVPEGTLSAADAKGFGAVALFCERAAAADHRFVLRDADVPAVVGLCQGLDGLPLAIELAAARASALGIPVLRDALGSGLQVLGGHRDRLAPARQRSVRAALEWSTGLLSPAARRLFGSLGVVTGSASLALVQRLAGVSADAWEVVDALDELIQRSLVNVVQEAAHPQTRYRLLELPRLLALELLASRGDEAEVRHRHAQGVLADFEALRTAAMAGQLRRRAMERLRELDLGNARQALAYARSQGKVQLELALFSASLLAASSAERLAMADRCMALMAQHDVQADPLLEYGVQRAISNALMGYRPAQSLLARRRALELARQVVTQQADRYELYLTLCELAISIVSEAGGQESAALLQEAATLEEAAWPAIRKQPLLNARASLAANCADPGLALLLYRRLLADELAAGETGHMPLHNLANAELAAGDASAAVASGQRLVAQLAGWRHEKMLAHASANLLLAHLALGEVAPARALAEQRWGHSRPAPMHAWFIDALALMAAMEGRYPSAAMLVAAAESRYRVACTHREINEQRAHLRTLALLEEADFPAPSPLPSETPLTDAELIALALALPAAAPSGSGASRH